jgi:hypothetical protein
MLTGILEVLRLPPSFLSNAQCVELGLEGAAVDDRGRSKFIFHDVFLALSLITLFARRNEWWERFYASRRSARPKNKWPDILHNAVSLAQRTNS